MNNIACHDLDDDANADARAEKQKRVDVCVGFLNDNKNKAEEMRQVVEEAVMILMLLTAGIRKTRSSWPNCALRDDEAV